MTTQQQNRSTPSVPDPFQSQGEISEIACIDNYMGFDQLSAYSIRSADALVECSLRDSCLLDVHIYTICFLYRHGLELILKDMVWKSHYILTGEKLFREGKLKIHKLTRLWNKCRHNSAKVLPDGWPLDLKDNKIVVQLLQQFELHDPESYSFRYPINNNTERTHQSLNNINIRVLSDRVRTVGNLLGIVIDQLGWCLDNCDR